MKELKFIHCTKCAGTYIEDLGKKHNKSWGRFHKEYKPNHHKKFTLLNPKVKKKYDWFIIVRNPYDRILSEYYCKWGGIGKNLKIKHNKQQFNSFLVRSIKKLAFRGKGSHYTPLHKYIDKSTKQYIIKYENLNYELNSLFNTVYKLNIKLSSQHRVNKRKINTFCLDDFSPELIELINKVYDKDFKLFGYKKFNNKISRTLLISSYTKSESLLSNEEVLKIKLESNIPINSESLSIIVPIDPKPSQDTITNASKESVSIELPKDPKPSQDTITNASKESVSIELPKDPKPSQDTIANVSKESVSIELPKDPKPSQEIIPNVSKSNNSGQLIVKSKNPKNTNDMIIVKSINKDLRKPVSKNSNKIVIPKQKLYLGLIARCKDEFFVKEFCDYYESQDVDKIYIIDDNSNDKSIYKNINKNKVNIIYEKNILKKKYMQTLYQKLRHKFQWIIICDIDEFITTKKNINKTIKEELKDNFNKCDCVKIPWVMMGCNNRQGNPKSILKENIWRWNHDKKHPHKNSRKFRKFRCRYRKIEVKCIVKCSKFKNVSDHIPSKCVVSKPLILDGTNKRKMQLNVFRPKLREKDIKNGYLLCYHYRVISHVNSKNKIKNNAWYKANGYSVKDIMATDHSEVMDATLKNKTK